MVRELVLLHGGTIEAQSTPDVGTTFIVTLPFGSAHLPADRLSAPSPEGAGVSAGAVPFVAEALRWLPGSDGGAVVLPPRASAPSAGPVAAAGAGRVLVADDNADMREYLLRLLAPHYSVASVSDGQAALDSALADPPDLVVSDVMMPGLDGMQLLAALRGDERTSRVPVVLLSARAGQQAAVEGLAAGADDYLVKPFSAQELLARVSAHLNLGRARRAAEERFTAMADLAPALIWVADPDGRRVFVNQGWAHFTGRAVGDALGHGWEDQLHPEDEQRYRQVVAGAAERREGWEVEFRLRRSDGAYHWLLERAVPIGSGKTLRRLRRQLHRHQCPLPRDRAADAAGRGGCRARPRDRCRAAAVRPGPADRHEPAGRVLRRDRGRRRRSAPDRRGRGSRSRDRAGHGRPGPGSRSWSRCGRHREVGARSSTCPMTTPPRPSRR